MEGQVEEQFSITSPEMFESYFKEDYENNLYNQQNESKNFTRFTQISNISLIFPNPKIESEKIEKVEQFSITFPDFLESNCKDDYEKNLFMKQYQELNYDSFSEKEDDLNEKIEPTEPFKIEILDSFILIPNISSIFPNPKNEPEKIEKEGKETNEESISLLNKKKKRKSHDKFDKDNIKRKIQVKYIKFLVQFVNKAILEIFFKYNMNSIIDIKNKKKIEYYQFKSLSYDFSKNVDSLSFNKYKSKKISEIFIENTSPKYKNYNNVDIYNNIIQINNKINNILNKPYLEFFDAFYKKQNVLNLKKYGFNLDIYLNDIKRFEQFTEEQKKQTSEKCELYIKRIEECINSDFIFSSNSPLFSIKSK